MRSAEGSSGDLARQLGPWHAFAVVVGLVIGSGIFRVPASVATDAGTPWAALGLWLAGGLLTLFLALCLAELATLFPHAGGDYVYLREAYGPVMAFLLGWTRLFVTPAIWAALALIFAEYLETLAPGLELSPRWIAAALVLLLGLLNLRSVGLGAIVQTSATAAKVGALAILAGAIFWLGDPSAGAFAAREAAEGGASWGELSWAGLGLGLIGVLFAYEGVTEFNALAGEVRDPQRSLPRALVGGTAVIVAVYLCVNVAYFWVLPWDQATSSPLIASTAIEQVAGRGGASMVAALVLLSTFGALAASVMTEPRVFFAMARDGLFPKVVGKVHPKWGTPHWAIGTSTVLALIFIASRTFEQLAETIVLGLWPFLSLAVAGVMVLRAKRPSLERPYRVPFYPLPPLLFLAGAVFLMANALVQHPGTTLLGLGVSALGLPVYFLWTRFARRA